MLPTVALAADTYAYPTSQPTPTWTGSGTEADPYVITTAQQLADLAWLVNNNMSAYQSAYYKLGGNIDLSGGTWTPIGYQASQNAARYFSGTFDGGSNTISGLNNVTCSGEKYVGLFGAINSGTVKNLTVGGTFTTSYQYAAGICAYASKSTFENCVSQVNITCTSTSTPNLGGIIGYGSIDMVIRNCTNSGTISYTGSNAGYIGGICGHIAKGSVVSGCSNSGAVTGSGYTVGGICGVRRNVITDCNNTGNVTGTYNVGGICGYLSMGDHKLSNCYNAGNITATAPSTSQSGVSVELNNNIIMNVYFTNQTADMTATVTFTNHNGNEITEDLTSTESANGYCFEVNQLAVADMRALVTVTCYHADGSVYGTVTDSVESYVARTGATKAINKAIMKFSDSAKAYLH